MVKDHLERQFRRKNLFIYLKKGRWVVLFLMLFSSIALIQFMFLGYGYARKENVNLFVMLSISFFSIINILGLVLFLVPVYFKNNQFRKFWIRFGILFMSCSIGDLVVIRSLQNLGMLEVLEINILLELSLCIFNQFNILLGVTGILYFFELFEEISLTRETRSNMRVIRESMRRMQGTKTDLPYLLQSLRGVRAKLQDQEAGKNTEVAAGDAILLFADILRYKLYGYEHQLVTLSEELQTVRDIIRFYNSVVSERAYYCEYEWMGDDSMWCIEKQQVVKLVYPFLSNSESPLFRDLLIYMEIKDGMLDLTVQCETSSEVYANQAIAKIREEVSDQTDNIIFDFQSENQQITLNLCLTLQKRSTAS